MTLRFSLGLRKIPWNVLTMDMETTDNTIIAMELIDKDLVMEYAKEQGEENKQNTAFAYLHHFE